MYIERMRNKDPLQQLIRDTFEYHYAGVLTWRKRKRGTIAGTCDPDGYVRVRMGRVSHPLHRLVWIYHHGPIPHGHVVDHFDGNPKNNTIDNLRAVPPQINARNLHKADRRNRSGVLGVHMKVRNGKASYYARISVEGRSVALGAFDTAEEAGIAYQKARIELFPDVFVRFPLVERAKMSSFDPCI